MKPRYKEVYEKEKQYENALDYVQQGIKLAEQEKGTTNLFIYNNIYLYIIISYLLKMRFE